MATANQFADNLRREMKARNLSELDLEKLSGVKQQNINRYLNGVHKPGAAKIAALAKALDVSPAVLLGNGSGPGRAASVLRLPVLGQVPAGPPGTGEYHYPTFFDFAARFGKDGLFMLRVRGTSMAGAAILPGDHVVVRPDRSPPPGVIVVAKVDGEATVKRLRKKGRLWELEADPPDAHPPIPLDPAKRNDVLGVVVGVVRTV